MRLGLNEIDVLKALARGEVPAASSSQRLRLELLGLAVDSAQGLKLTRAGHAAAQTASPTDHETMEQPPRQVDAAGRKRMLERLNRLPT